MRACKGNSRSNRTTAQAWGKTDCRTNLARSPGFRGENIIIFSGDDWGSGLKTSKYHLACQLARHNRVLFVNSIGLRAVKASSRDLKRVFGKLRAFFRGATRTPEGPYVHTPIALPFLRGNAAVNFINGLILKLCIQWLCFRLHLTRPIVFAFTVTFNDVISSLKAKAIVYYCIDDLRSFAGIDQAWFDQEEGRLLSRVDCAVACSEKLHAMLCEKGCQSYHVPHGVEWGLFRTAVTDDLPLPDDMAVIPEPQIGFFGFITEEWFDFPLVRRIAAQHPEWHVVLIGKPSTSLDVKALLPEPNIHYLGPKPFEQLPAYSRHFAVGLIPFQVNAITDHCNPLKALEYLASGLPVVSTDIPELRRCSGDVHLARSHEEFIALCERALMEGSQAARNRRSMEAQAHSWDSVVAQICEIVSRHIARKAAP